LPTTKAEVTYQSSIVKQHSGSLALPQRAGAMHSTESPQNEDYNTTPCSPPSQCCRNHASLPAGLASPGVKSLKSFTPSAASCTWPGRHTEVTPQPPSCCGFCERQFRWQRSGWES